jgi:hypothetical protein
MSRRIGTRKAVPKTDGTEAAEGYTVGFRRPPAATRFKPGVSGNPTGRPKGCKNITMRVRDEMTAPVAIREGEKIRKVPMIVAVALRQLQNAIKGNERAATAAFQMARQMGLLQDPTPDSAEAPSYSTTRRSPTKRCRKRLAEARGKHSMLTCCSALTPKPTVLSCSSCSAFTRMIWQAACLKRAAGNI